MQKIDRVVDRVLMGTGVTVKTDEKEDPRHGFEKNI